MNEWMNEWMNEHVLSGSNIISRKKYFIQDTNKAQIRRTKNGICQTFYEGTALQQGHFVYNKFLFLWLLNVRYTQDTKNRQPESPPDESLSESACLNKEEGNLIWFLISDEFLLISDMLLVMENVTPLNWVISVTSRDISVKKRKTVKMELLPLKAAH